MDPDLPLRINPRAVYTRHGCVWLGDAHARREFEDMTVCGAGEKCERARKQVIARHAAGQYNVFNDTVAYGLAAATCICTAHHNRPPRICISKSV
eukprot:COSAG01_NODE_985_length_12329_cov_363.217171_14_plen_95_part_00